MSASKFEPKEIDQAGRILANVPAEGEDDREWVDAFRYIGRWRAAHAGPLATFRNNLQRRVGRRGIVAQRLKRMPTIISKLGRLPWLKLSRMQDVGGCRVILPTADEAFWLATDYADSKIRHEWVGFKDYINDPRSSGYRGLHLVYGYHSERRPDWHGLKTEIQIRSQLQHQWATAVETVGTFTRNDLKSSIGDSDWLRFFALMSAVIALKENAPPVPDTPTDYAALVDEIRDLDETLGIVESLATVALVTHLLSNTSRFRNRWVVLTLDLVKERIQTDYFSETEKDVAGDFYAFAELSTRHDPYIQVVMVSINSLGALRRAYPNYFADLTEFTVLVSEVLD